MCRAGRAIFVGEDYAHPEIKSMTRDVAKVHLITGIGAGEKGFSPTHHWHDSAADEAHRCQVRICFPFLH